MSIILDKARELAEAITASEELKALREAEIQVKNDPSAQALIARYNEQQKRIQAAFREAGGPSPELSDELEKLEEALEAHATVGPFLVAQHNFEQIISSLNFLITKAINGEGEECSSGCSGCGGGCGH